MQSTRSIHSVLAQSPNLTTVTAAASTAGPAVATHSPEHQHMFTSPAFSAGSLNELLQVFAAEPTENIKALVDILDSQLNLRDRLRGALQRWKRTTPAARVLGPELTRPLKIKLERAIRDELKIDFPIADIQIGYWVEDAIRAMVVVEFKATTLFIAPLLWTSGYIEIRI